MELNSKDRLLTIKIVYYGPALGGKTTNLQTVHALTDRERRTELISIATRDDRTLFFDLLPLGLGRFLGFDLKLKLFTVPGQVQFDVTRRKVLAGADAVVFVADSQREHTEANAQSFKNLRVNLIQNKLDPKTIPLALQYNKRDLPDLQDLAEMDEALNERRVPSFPAVATEGPGVMECLAAAASMAIEGLVTMHRLAPPAEGKRAAAQVRSTLLGFAVKRDAAPGDPAAARSSPPAAGVNWTHRAHVKVSDDVDLLEQAVDTNLALSERIEDLHARASRAERRDAQVRSLAEFSRLAEEGGEPAGIERRLLALSLASLGLSRGSLLARRDSGGLDVRALAGQEADPLASIASPPLQSLAERLIAGGRPILCNDMLTELFFGDPTTAPGEVFTLLFSPLRTVDGLFAGLFLYGCEPDEPFDQTDGMFVEAACRVVSLARLRALA